MFLDIGSSLSDRTRTRTSPIPNLSTEPASSGVTGAKELRAEMTNAESNLDIQSTYVLTRSRKRVLDQNVEKEIETVDQNRREKRSKRSIVNSITNSPVSRRLRPRKKANIVT